MQWIERYIKYNFIKKWSECLCPPEVPMLNPATPMWWCLEVEHLGGESIMRTNLS